MNEGGLDLPPSNTASPKGIQMSVFKRVSGFAAAALTALSLSTADATIIGQASYLGTAGDVFNPGAANLEMQLDGVGIFNVPGTGVFNLATDSPTAFALSLIHI